MSGFQANAWLLFALAVGIIVYKNKELIWEKMNDMMDDELGKEPSPSSSPEPSNKMSSTCGNLV